MLKWLLLEGTKLEQEVKLFALHLQQLLVDENDELETSLNMMTDEHGIADAIATAFIFIELHDKKYSIELTTQDQIVGVRVILHSHGGMGFAYIDGPLVGLFWKAPTAELAKMIIAKLHC